MSDENVLPILGVVAASLGTILVNLDKKIYTFSEWVMGFSGMETTFLAEID